MAKRKLTDEQQSLKDRVMKVYTRPFGFRYHDPSWPKDLWGRDAYEIYEFLENRLNTTLNEVEYYATMIYLVNVVPDADLFFEFRALQRVVESRTYNYLSQNTTMNRIQQKAIEPVETGVNTIGILGSENILGGL